MAKLIENLRSAVNICKQSYFPGFGKMRRRSVFRKVLVDNFSVVVGQLMVLDEDSHSLNLDTLWDLLFFAFINQN